MECRLNQLSCSVWYVDSWTLNGKNSEEPCRVASDRIQIEATDVLELAENFC